MFLIIVLLVFLVTGLLVFLVIGLLVFLVIGLLVFSGRIIRVFVITRIFRAFGAWFS